ALQARQASSLDGARTSGERDTFSVLDTYGSDDPGYLLCEHRALLSPALRTLPRREQVILQLRYTEGLTQSQIAQRIGISQMHVSRLLTRAIATLRENLQPPAEPIAA